MNINVGDLLTIENEKYITIEVLNYEGKNYAFVNKVIEPEEITEEFYIFKVVDDNIIIIEDDNLKNILIPRFEESLKRIYKNIINE